MMKPIGNVVVMAVLLASLTALCSARREKSRNRADHSADEANQARVEFDPAAPKRIEVWKGKRELILYQNEKVLRRYRVALGFAPLGHKSQEGDGKTPEGEYLLCVKNPKSKYELSLGITYPNARDAEHARNAGLISHAEAAEIVRASQEQRTPPWKTKLGGEVFIHGGGGAERGDWTWGCVALSNEDIRDLYPLVEKHTKIVIRP